MIYRLTCTDCGARVIARRTTGMPRTRCLQCQHKRHYSAAQAALVRMTAANPV